MTWPNHQRWGTRLGWMIGALFVLAVPTGLLWETARPVFHKDIINKYAPEYQLDPLLVMALMRVESSFDHRALSARGAQGLMQIMPDTAQDMARRLGRPLPAQALNDPDFNIHLGMEYLHFLRLQFGSDWVKVLSAYNAGPGNVRAWTTEVSTQTLTIDNIPFPETQQFVRRVLATHRWLKRFQSVKNVFSV